MNIAFPALLTVILVLPGIILRYAYTRGSWRWNSPISIRGLSDEIAYGLVFAIGLHTLWIAFVSRLGFSPDLYSILVLLTGTPNNQNFEPAIIAISGHLYGVTFYFLILCTLAAILGACAHHLVRRFKLDRKTRTFRFRNEWYYLLSGEAVEFKEMDGKDALPVDGVFLSALIEQGGTSYLYQGLVVDFWFDRNGALDRILLELTRRRPFSANEPTTTNDDAGTASSDDRYYDIEGDVFVLRYSDTKTINLDYFYLEENTES